MIDHGKQNVLGIWIDAVDYEAAVSRIILAAKARQGMSVTALAVHGVMTGVLDPVQRYRLNKLDLATPDGQPVRWALQWLHGIKLFDRVYGPNLMLRVCEQAERENLSIYLYGSQPSVINSLIKNLKGNFPRLKIAGAEPSRFRQVSPKEREEILRRISNSGAALTFVGLGCPRQEVWIFENRDDLRMPVIAVGAAFDFHAGNLPQAPTHLQSIGLEWLFRLQNEPKRLWRRYIFLNPLYISYLILQKTGLKHFDPGKAIRPTEEKRYF